MYKVLLDYQSILSSHQDGKEVFYLTNDLMRKLGVFEFHELFFLANTLQIFFYFI
jgi:hypothetical protein